MPVIRVEVPEGTPQETKKRIREGVKQAVLKTLAPKEIKYGYVAVREAFGEIGDGLPPRTESFLTDWRPHGLALDCSYPPRDDPKNHNDWTTALTVIDKVKPQRAWLTHISHTLDAWLLDTGESSPRAAIAMDGDRVDLQAGFNRPSS